MRILVQQKRGGSVHNRLKQYNGVGGLDKNSVSPSVDPTMGKAPGKIPAKRGVLVRRIIGDNGEEANRMVRSAQ